MNRTQAMKEAARLWGTRSAVRDSGKPTSEAKRKAASEELKVLRAIPVKERTKEQREQLNNALGRALSYRYSVGYIGGIPAMGFAFFSVQGQGDTWEEAFAKAARGSDIEGRRKAA